MSEKYEDLGIIQLRSMVIRKLHWMKKKVETLDKRECLILLRNKEKFIRKKIYCNCCGEKIKIEDMRKRDKVTMRKCRSCHAKGRGVNPEYDDYELQILNDIEITDITSNIEKTCDEIQKKLIREFSRYSNYLIHSNIDLSEDEILKKFFSEFPFTQSNKWDCINHKSLFYLRKDLISEWDNDQNKAIKLNPKEELTNSHKCAHWICPKKHKYQMMIRDRVNGQGCKFCSKMTESKFYHWLLKEYPNKEVTREKSFDWSISKFTGAKLRFDFIIDKIIIEVDGRQHFAQVSNWQDPKVSQIKDFFKMERALENGFHFIRIFQGDVYNDKNDWERKTKEAILLFRLNESNNPVIYIGSKNIYKEYEENFQNHMKLKAPLAPKSEEQKEKAETKEIISKIEKGEIYDDLDEIWTIPQSDTL